MTPKRKLSDVDDGTITGIIPPQGRVCDACGTVTRCIRIHGLALPKEFYEFKDSHDLIRRLVFSYENGSAVTYIGIGCGCYAKGHRQISHIRDNLKRKK